MIEPIVIKVVDKVPIVASGPQYVVCDNSDYTVVWQLDEEWAQLEHRTMQVNYKDGTYERVLFTGDSCTLPAIPVSGPVHVGLFAGDIHTTRPARLLAVRSATTDSGEERDPMPNGYAQAIEALDAKLDKNQGADNAGKALVVGDDGNVVPGRAQGGGSLPAMSNDTAGKMLTNDGEKAEWADVPREIMYVNFTQEADGKWSADKNWHDAAAVIAAGGVVYANTNRGIYPVKSYSASYYYMTFSVITIMLLEQGFYLVMSTLRWEQDGRVEEYNEPGPVLMYAPQTLTAAEQAQARINIGAGTPYTLPVASPTQLGGVKPVAKTDAMTQRIGVDGNGGLYTEPAEVYYIDLAGDYPNYTCSVAMADIKAAYEAGKELKCRCAMGQYNATLPLFIPMPDFNAWIFSGSGALKAPEAEMLYFDAQSLTIAIANGTVKASNTQLATKGDIPTIPAALPNPNALTVKVGSTTTTYDGSSAQTVEIADGSDGLSPSEKNLILTLFESLPYTEDVSLTVSSLKKLWNGTAVYYPVTYNLTDVTAKNPVASVIEGGTLEVELEPDDGTEISSVSVTMSGTDITAAVYSAGRITIPSVSGAVVIAAVSAAAGFTPLEYLEGDGTAWINTGYSPSTQDLVEIKFAPTATAWDYVFSMYASSKATYGLRLRAAYSGTGTSFTRRGGGSNAELNDGVAFDWVYNTVYVLKETSFGTATIHNESGESLLTISDPQVGNFAEPTNPIFLWIRSNGTAPYGRVACEERIYSFKVVDAYGNAKLDLIPVLDGDGVACMYDKVSKRFLHDGTGGNTFIAGGQQ